MNLKVIILEDFNVNLKKNDMLEFDEETYTDWYLDVGRLVVHDVKEEN